jgi:hypothetical protein
MKYEYRTIDTSTIQGLKAAEKLHLSGEWRIIANGLFSIQFERKVK